jgi:hypothetical protein
MPNISMERQILLAAQTAAPPAQLSACSTVLQAIERNADKKTADPHAV